MGDNYAVVIEGLTDPASLDGMEEAVIRAARRAVNKATDRARAMAARMIREQVNFPASYLAPSGGRLKVATYASGDKLEGKIVAQARPTSLARFVVGNTKGAGLTVQVSPGRARFMRRAFLIKLRQGSGSVDTQFNMGLAMRLKPGESIQNKKSARKLAANLYLLYGPSVQQAFINAQGKGVALDISPEIASFLEHEYVRQLEL